MQGVVRFQSSGAAVENALSPSVESILAGGWMSMVLWEMKQTLFSYFVFGFYKQTF